MIRVPTPLIALSSFRNRGALSLLSLALPLLILAATGVVANAQAPAASKTVGANAPAASPSPSIPPDDDSIICNHIRPKVSPPDIRCKNAITAGRILLFARGTKPAIDFPIQNDRAQAVPADCVLTLTDREGKQIDQKSASLTLTANAATNFSYTFDTAHLKYGLYSLTLRISAGGQSLAQREYYAGVISSARIPKAADGDFLYGLDPNFGGITAKDPQPAELGKRARQGQCSLLEWIDAMGVDILRNAGIGIEPNAIVTYPDLHLNTQDLEILRQHQLRLMIMASPLAVNYKVPNGFAEEDVRKWTALVEKAARELPDVTYWELGNEPDLGYSSMDLYVRIFEETSRAIKRGNPKAKIMNGGITFFGAFGPGNSRRFLQLVNPDCIDVIAYHAHGPGSQAERNTFEKVRKYADKYGKGDKAFADTESGMFVGSRKQEDAQAWMVVQKQTYAQAMGLKFLMTFRLHAFRSETGWGLLRSDQEPNPAIVAYRTMTEHLKGLAFQKTLAPTQTYAEGYSFAQANGPQRACVIWSNQPAFYNVYLKIAASARDARNPRFMDIYGNSSPAEIGEDGVARVEVTQVPVYLLWDAADPAFQASVTHSMVRTPDMATVVPNATAPLRLTVDNPTDSEMSATLSASVSASGSASVTPAKQDLTIPAHKSVPAGLEIQWTPPRTGITWPASWLVYTDLQESEVNLADIKQIPTNLNGTAGWRLQPVGGSIPLLRPGESPRERRAGFVFANIESEADQVVKIGCAADYWMELRLNGQVVCSTMEKGNGSSSVSERILELPLKKGDNLLAAKVLSGKGGWALSMASPSDLAALANPEKASNCVDLALESDGKVLARERLALRPARGVAPLDDIKWSDAAVAWTNIAPDFSLENANVTNLYDKQPDRSKWWQGNNDLSATAWIRCDGKRIYLVVRVVDDKDISGTGPDKLTDSDSLQIGISGGTGDSSADGKPAADIYTIGRTVGKTMIYKDATMHGLAKGVVDAGASEIIADVTRDGTATFYRVSLDRSVAGDGVFGLNFLVNDNDDGYRKQYIQSSGGLGEAVIPGLWQQFSLAPKKNNQTP